VLSARLAIEDLIGEALRGRVRISEAPLVEGAVIGAVEASVGADLDAVDRAATGTAGMRKAQD
jgi:dihydroxyacetone kinase DhaKLM complex PTS-EIIA-like component DhaM